MSAISNRRRLALFGSAAVVALASMACSDPCDEPGTACTWAGQPGKIGFSEDGAHRLDLALYWPMDMLFAADGTPWFIDWNNHLVRTLDKDGDVKTVVGWTDPVFPGDGAPEESGPDGAVGTDVQLNHPTDLVQKPDGTILLMAWHNHKLRSIDPATGRVKLLGGAGAGFAGDGSTIDKALFRQPQSLELDSDGNAYILDQQNFRIRRVTPEGVITTIAGTGTSGFGGDGGPAKEAQFAFEAGSNPEPTGGLAHAAGKLFVSDSLNNRIRAIDLQTGIVTTVAGSGEKGDGGDGGPAVEARFNHPRDLEIGPEGHLYVADTDNSRIRAVDLTTGIVRTVAGTGELGVDDDDRARPATQTKLKRPFGIAFDAEGHLYVSDTINSRILRVAK